MEQWHKLLEQEFMKIVVIKLISLSIIYRRRVNFRIQNNALWVEITKP